MIEEILMGLGAAIWIAGELYAARKGEDTTTSYVRRFMRASKVGWLARAGAALFTVWLFLHFNFGLF